MKPFYNTPGLVNPPYQQRQPKQPTGQELVDWLEIFYADYRKDVENRLCQDDPKVHAEYKRKIEAARKTML